MSTYDENQQQQYAMHQANEAEQQTMDTVNEWLADNPGRLNYAYDNTTAVLDWKREAVKRLQASDEDASDVLEAWATEAEEANA